ncbi:hypothetical protein SBC1_72610 (plasmid) [Caballeronia sp. SBC1]|nr:hypothetical protein SBC2_74280 [Caballeronia sp. SBC2]QIN67214.1 hypothetical protein SBC1_72610 [Caballeronia sp. SBC1]
MSRSRAVVFAKPTEMADDHDRPLGDWRLPAGPTPPALVIGLLRRVERFINFNSPLMTVSEYRARQEDNAKTR